MNKNINKDIHLKLYVKFNIKKKIGEENKRNYYNSSNKKKFDNDIILENSK